MSGECRHEQFVASVLINRVESFGELAAFVADVTVTCAQCGLAFVFVGTPLGLSYDQPHVSADGTTLRAPIAPSFTWQGAGVGARGYTVRGGSV